METKVIWEGLSVKVKLSYARIKIVGHSVRFIIPGCVFLGSNAGERDLRIYDRRLKSLQAAERVIEVGLDRQALAWFWPEINRPAKASLISGGGIQFWILEEPEIKPNLLLSQTHCFENRRGNSDWLLVKKDSFWISGIRDSGIEKDHANFVTLTDDNHEVIIRIENEFEEKKLITLSSSRICST